MTDKIDLLTLIADDRNMVSYRPRWNQVTGSVNATILLQQIIYRWVHHGRRPFYKFQEPCDHTACRPGDSWCEELGFTRFEFRAARKLIAAKTKQNLAPDTFVSFWLDGQRKTWYAVNETAVVAALAKLYPEKTTPTAGLQEALLPAEVDHNLSGKNQLSNGQLDHNLSGKSGDSSPEKGQVDHNLSGENQLSSGQLDNNLSGKNQLSPQVDHNLSGNNQLSTPPLSGKNRLSNPLLSRKNQLSPPPYVEKVEIAKSIKSTYLTTRDNTIGDEKRKDGFFAIDGKENPQTAKDLWDAVLTDLRPQMTRATFDAWLPGSELYLRSPTQALIVVRSEYAAEWINARLLPTIGRTLAALAAQAFPDLQAITHEELAQLQAFQAVGVGGGA